MSAIEFNALTHIEKANEAVSSFCDICRTHKLLSPALFHKLQTHQLELQRIEHMMYNRVYDED